MESLLAISAHVPVCKADKLANLAHQKVLAFLVSVGNQISQTHELALRELLQGMANQVLGIETGRLAYALPCGAGKTQCVVALIAAAHELGYTTTFAVSAAQILALARLKHDLVNAGVPKEQVGLRHSKQRSDIEAAARDSSQEELFDYLEDTGEKEYPIMLVCHARIRGAKEFPAFCNYLGQRRNLLIWDETLMTTDAQALAWPDVKTSIQRILPELSPCSALALVLYAIEQKITSEFTAQKAKMPPTSFLLMEGLDLLSARSQLESLPKSGGALRLHCLDVIRQLLRLVELPVAVAITGNGYIGDGLIRYTVAVDPRLNNIAILDASHSIRVLGQEKSIQNRTTPAMRNCKNYSRVQVTEVRIAAGKSTLLDKPESGLALAKEVASHLRKVPSSEFILLFTHKGDGRVSLLLQLQTNLKAEGINIDELIGGRKRFNWLTWGNETSLNTMRHCTHAMLCGVMRRGPLELAASMAGKQDDLHYRMSHEELKALVVSEMAHCVCGGQVISDTSIDRCFADSRSKALGDKFPSVECSRVQL